MSVLPHGVARQRHGTMPPGSKVARFGDNMREVAVTEGDKVAAQIQLRYSVNGYGVGDLAAVDRASRRAKSTTR